MINKTSAKPSCETRSPGTGAADSGLAIGALSTVIGVILLLCALGVAPPSAQAAPVAHWGLIVTPTPSAFSEDLNATCAESFDVGKPCDSYSVLAVNDGSAMSTGSIHIEDDLPPTLRLQRGPAGGIGETSVAINVNYKVPLQCEQSGSEAPADCKDATGETMAEAFCDVTSLVDGGTHVACDVTGVQVPAYKSFELALHFKVTDAALGSEVTDTAAVEGGGAPRTEIELQTPVEPEYAIPYAASNNLFEVLNEGGTPDRQAGGHPTAVVAGFLSTIKSGVGTTYISPSKPSEAPKDTVVRLPLGFIGNPTVAPRCRQALLMNGNSGESNCPVASQVGVATVDVEGQYSNSSGAAQVSALYNIEPDQGYPAEFGFTLHGKPVFIHASLVREGGEYFLQVVAPEIPAALFAPGAFLTFFGDRTGLAGPGAEPFLTNPSQCQADGPDLQPKLDIDSYLHPGDWDTAGQITAGPLATDSRPLLTSGDWVGPDSWTTGDADPYPGGIEGCGALSFQASVAAEPTSSTSDSPTGLKVNLKVPQDDDPNGLATPDLRDATVTLPQGLVVDPSSADGLGVCSEGEIGLESVEPGTCPEDSQIGELDLSTPLLDHPLPGKVYLGVPECAPCSNAEAAAGKVVRLYIEVDDPASGVVVKLPGSGKLDPATGQISATFEDNPQLPFEELSLSLKSGPRATLTTPSTCGEFTTSSDLKPWSAPQSGPDATSQSRFQIASGPGGSACAGTEAQLPNRPVFKAGTSSQIAGSYSPFVLNLSRENGSQRFSSLEATLPEGLLGRLAGIPYCSDAAIAAAAGRSGASEKTSPSCPASSEVGSVTVGAGSGNPFYVQGKAYLAGPYKGAPISLAIITPAVAGPFDLGTVVVRSALYVNEYSTQVRAVTDPIPSILAGIPLDVRSIALQLNRPDFTLNPSSCEAKEIVGNVRSTVGQTTQLKNRFQVGACNALAFKPSLKLSLNGQVKRLGHPALKAVLTYPKSPYANIARAQVNLPHSEFLDQGNLNKTCTKPVLVAGKCPPSTIYGTAKAWTPLLEKPLEGPVYLVGGFGYKLPALVAELNGQLRVLLVGKVDSGKNKGIRNTFEAVPDAPVSRFVLELKGGKKYGLLENSESLCASPQKAISRFTGQNGKTYDTEPVIQVSCGKKSKGKGGKKGT